MIAEVIEVGRCMKYNSSAALIMCRNRKQHVQKPDKVFFFYFYFYFSSEAIYTTQQLLFIEHLITIALITPTVLLILNFEYVKIHPGANSAVKTNLAQHAMLTG